MGHHLSTAGRPRTTSCRSDGRCPVVVVVFVVNVVIDVVVDDVGGVVVVAVSQ